LDCIAADIGKTQVAPEIESPALLRLAAIFGGVGVATPLSQRLVVRFKHLVPDAANPAAQSWPKDRSAVSIE
jgi:hypothetical protein